jgi:hypothetical protein
MSFTSHTFTSLPLVHTPNLDFLRRRLWLGFLLIRESPHSGNLHTPRLPKSNFSRFPNSANSRFHGFAGPKLQIFSGSRLRSFAGSRFQIFASSRLRGFAGSRFQIFASSRLRGFAGSRFQIFASSRLQSFAGSTFLKTYFTNFVKLNVSRVIGFPKFPNTSPRGSGLTPTIRFHENHRISEKKMSPSQRRSGHASSVNLATVESRRVLETAPPSPL